MTTGRINQVTTLRSRATHAPSPPIDRPLGGGERQTRDAATLTLPAWELGPVGGREPISPREFTEENSPNPTRLVSTTKHTFSSPAKPGLQREVSLEFPTA